MNTVEYIRNLEAVGFTRAQAEVQAVGFIEMMEAKFATKQDLQNAVTELRHEIRELEHRMTIKLGSLIAAGIALLHFFK